MAATDDPTVSLEAKINAFAATLTDDERTVLHEVLHLAADGGEVHGFAMPTQPGLGRGGDPCEGGEVTFPGTFRMLGALHVSIHEIHVTKTVDKSSPNLFLN